MNFTLPQYSSRSCMNEGYNKWRMVESDHHETSQDQQYDWYNAFVGRVT